MDKEALELVLAWAVGGACAYEVTALVSRGKLPTLSCVCRTIRRSPLGFVAIFVAIIWLAYHLLMED